MLLSRSTEIIILTVLKLACAVAVVVSIIAQPAGVQAQQRAGTAETDQVQPINSGPNPYRIIRDWAQLTLEKRPWGGSNGVAVERDGKVTIFVPPHKTDGPDGAMGEGIAIDSAGNLFTAEATVRGVTKYLKD
jgi:hypothetical protein